MIQGELQKHPVAQSHLEYARSPQPAQKYARLNVALSSKTDGYQNGHFPYGILQFAVQSIYSDRRYNPKLQKMQYLHRPLPSSRSLQRPLQAFSPDRSGSRHVDTDLHQSILDRFSPVPPMDPANGVQSILHHE